MIRGIRVADEVARVLVDGLQSGTADTGWIGAKVALEGEMVDVMAAAGHQSAMVGNSWLVGGRMMMGMWLELLDTVLPLPVPVLEPSPLPSG